MRLNFWQNHSADTTAELFSSAAKQRLPQKSNECSIPTVCGETTTLCLNSHRASMLHSPTQPLPRGLVGNGTNEPPEPLRRTINTHAKPTQRRVATKPCFDSLQPWYQGQFKTPLQSRLSAGERVIPQTARRCHGCVRHKNTPLQVKRPKWHTHPGNLVP